MKRLVAKKPTKKELKELELQQKNEMGAALIATFPETFLYLSEDKSYVPKYITQEIKQYGYDIEDLKTEGCDFIFQNLLYQCQNIYDSISDQCFGNPEESDYGSVDDPNSKGRNIIDGLIENYEQYTTERLYQMVPDALIENVRAYNKR